MLKFALVGCGRISKRHSELWRKSDLWRSIGGCVR